MGGAQGAKFRKAGDRRDKFPFVWINHICFILCVFFHNFLSSHNIKVVRSKFICYFYISSMFVRCFSVLGFLRMRGGGLELAK